MVLDCDDEEGAEAEEEEGAETGDISWETPN